MWEPSFLRPTKAFGTCFPVYLYNEEIMQSTSFIIKGMKDAPLDEERSYNELDTLFCAKKNASFVEKRYNQKIHAATSSVISSSTASDMSRATWKSETERTFINLFGYYTNEMHLKGYSKDLIRKKLVIEMEKQEYKYTVDQCRFKLKCMEQEYRLEGTEYEYY